VVNLSTKIVSQITTKDKEQVTPNRQAAHYNELLSALSDEEYQRLRPNLRPVTLSVGQVVYEAGERLGAVYFPTTSVLSLVQTTGNGSSVGLGVVGSDGMLGVALVLGGETMLHSAIAQIAGDAIVLGVKAFKTELFLGGGLQETLLWYTQALLTQISQTAVCSRLHSMEQRFCRWLLLWQERTHSEELLLTQERISQILGGRRESVTIATAHLHDAGVIQSNHRGRIRIIDRIALENMACECHRVVKEECSRLHGMRQKDRRRA
jgi:CRP-like cAMP-binding protein